MSLVAKKLVDGMSAPKADLDQFFELEEGKSMKSAPLTDGSPLPEEESGELIVADFSTEDIIVGDFIFKK